MAAYRFERFEGFGLNGFVRYSLARGELVASGVSGGVVNPRTASVSLTSIRVRDFEEKGMTSGNAWSDRLCSFTGDLVVPCSLIDGPCQ